MAPEHRRSVTFVAEELHSSGGLELFEHAIGRSLAARGWRVVMSYERPGDLAASWSEFAEMRRLDEHPDRAALIAGTDVAYCHWGHLLVPTLEAAQRAGRPMAAHLHLPPFHLREGWRGLVRGRLRWPVDERVFSKHTEVGGFAAVSEFTRRQWIASGLPADRVRTIHNGLDPTVFHPPAPDERRAVRAELGFGDDEVVVGFVGRLDPLKGIHHLVDAFVPLAARDPRLRLVVVGAPTRHDIETGVRFAADLEARSPASVVWLGKRTDTARLYRAFDAFAMPSGWDEPFGLVLIEALASGVPAIASRRGGVPEIMTGDLARWLVEPTVDGIRAGLAELLAADRVDLGRRVADHVRSTFTLERTAVGVERLLVDVIEQRTRR